LNKNNHFGNTANTTISECANDTSIYKLAQLPTNLKKPKKKPLTPLQKRARSKWFSQIIINALLQIDDSDLYDYYKNASECNHTLEQKGKKLKSKFCNTRVCNICNRVRTAKLMNGYILQFSQFDKLEFTTLTRPNVKESELRKEIELLIKKSSNIIRIIREKRKIDISGIRKIEITYNPITNTYHPHLHILSNGYGNIIIELWLKQNPEANIKGQHTTEATQESLNELFKYSTKFLNKSPNKAEMDLYVRPLDKIMIALYKKRTFQPFGKIKKIKEDPEDHNTKMVLISQEHDELNDDEFYYWLWDYDCDWEELISLKKLTNYKKPNYKINIYE